MKTAEEILMQECFGNFIKELPKNDRLLNSALKSMKLYANQKLDEAGEIDTFRKFAYEHKQSILSLKDQI